MACRSYSFHCRRHYHLLASLNIASRLGCSTGDSINTPIPLPIWRQHCDSFQGINYTHCDLDFAVDLSRDGNDVVVVEDEALAWSDPRVPFLKMVVRIEGYLSSELDVVDRKVQDGLYGSDKREYDAKTST